MSLPTEIGIVALLEEDKWTAVYVTPDEARWSFIESNKCYFKLLWLQ